MMSLLKLSRSYGHFKGVMASRDFTYYTKLYLYRRRAYHYKWGKSEAVVIRVNATIARLNLEMTRVCAPYGLVPKNSGGLSVEEFLAEVNAFLDDNVKPE